MTPRTRRGLLRWAGVYLLPRLPLLMCALIAVAALLFFADISRSGAGRPGSGSGTAARGTRSTPSGKRSPRAVVSKNIESETGEMDPLMEKALNAFGASRYDECRKLAQDLISTSNDSSTRAECVGILILSPLQQGEFASAREAAERLRTVSPDVCQDLLAQVNREERDYNAEVTRLQQIVATTKDPAEAARAQLWTGHAHQWAGRLGMAAESYGRLVDLWPGDACTGRALAGLVIALARAGRAEDGLARCEEVMGRYPQDVNLARSGTSAV